MLGLVFGLGLVAGLVFGLVEGGTSERSSLGPHEVWRYDQMAGLIVGLVAGFVGVLVGMLIGGLEFTLGDMLVGGHMGGLGNGLVFGLLFGLVLGLMVAPLTSVTWTATLSWLQLRWSGHVAAVGLMCFLEDARKRDVLRTVGAVYQFRHATLQDQLASYATTNSEPSTAASPTSLGRNQAKRK